MLKGPELCIECKTKKATLHANRGILSPGRGWPLFCNDCVHLSDEGRYEFWAELDRNASDSECFQHDHWEGRHRVGTCTITGEKVRVEPMMPSENSGQPKSCTEHFMLRARYRT